MKLTETQIRALKLTHRGKETLVVRQSETPYQPEGIQAAILEFPHLAQLGLMTIEWLNDSDFMCRITAEGRAALRSDEP